MPVAAVIGGAALGLGGAAVAGTSLLAGAAIGAGGGLLSSAMGGGGGGNITIQGQQTPAQTATERDIQLEILRTLREEPELTESQKLMEEYTTQVLEQQIADMPAEREYRELQTQFLTEQMGYARQQLEYLSEAREMGEITGDLSPDEIAKLDLLQENAITSLTEVVGEEAQEIVGKEIASLVDRGVLQGEIGARALGKIGEQAVKEVARGTRDIGSLRVIQELQMESEKRQFGLQQQELVQRGTLSREQALTGMAQFLPSQQMAQTQMALQAGQFQPQLAQQWETTKLTGALGMWGQMAGMRGAEANRALQAAIATSQAQAAQTASQWGALGNIAGMAGMAAINKWGGG